MSTMSVEWVLYHLFTGACPSDWRVWRGYGVAMARGVVVFSLSEGGEGCAVSTLSVEWVLDHLFTGACTVAQCTSRWCCRAPGVVDCDHGTQVSDVCSWPCVSVDC